MVMSYSLLLLSTTISTKNESQVAPLSQIEGPNFVVSDPLIVLFHGSFTLDHTHAFFLPIQEGEIRSVFVRVIFSVV